MFDHDHRANGIPGCAFCQAVTDGKAKPTTAWASHYMQNEPAVIQLAQSIRKAETDNEAITLLADWLVSFENGLAEGFALP